MKALKVLIVEDETIVAMHLARNLTASGFKVCESVTSGEKAVQTVKDTQPDVVIMDRRLAGKMDGFEATQQIRAFSQIPIIFVTGYPDENLKEQILELQPAAYLTKPVQTREIESAIDLMFDQLI